MGDSKGIKRESNDINSTKSYKRKVTVKRHEKISEKSSKSATLKKKVKIEQKNCTLKKISEKTSKSATLKKIGQHLLQ